MQPANYILGTGFLSEKVPCVIKNGEKYEKKGNKKDPEEDKKVDRRLGETKNEGKGETGGCKGVKKKREDDKKHVQKS